MMTGFLFIGDNWKVRKITLQMAANLPKLPGFSADKTVKDRFHLPHSLYYRNGYRIPERPKTGIGGRPLDESLVQFNDLKADSYFFDPKLTYGVLRKPQPKPFVPEFVLYDKQCLTFFATFVKTNFEDEDINRTHCVRIVYFLEDDTVTVLENPCEKIGLCTGRIIRRSRIAKPGCGDTHYIWKDFNIGRNVNFNGINFHIVDCDPFTKEFLLSKGVELVDPELNLYNQMKQKYASKVHGIRPATTKKHSDQDDKLRRFLFFQGKVLSFDCILESNDPFQKEMLTYKLYYYLEDDTISIKELKENQQGRHKFPLLLNRTKVLKNPGPVQTPFVEDTTNAEDYYLIGDLKIGERLNIFGRNFLLTDCDQFTRNYYETVLRNPQPRKHSLQREPIKQTRADIPEYLGLGTPEDSLASYLNLVPKAPKKDTINFIVNANKYLRYECALESPHAEDRVRKFILKYRLSDDTITIVELPVDNSGIVGGRFLSSQKVWKPNCDRKIPEYYSPKDLLIGSTLVINSHRFKIISADVFVYKFMKDKPELFTEEAISQTKQFLISKGNLIPETLSALNSHEIPSVSHNELTHLEQKLKDVNLLDKDRSQYPGCFLEDEEESRIKKPGIKIDISQLKTQDSCSKDRTAIDYHQIPPESH